MAEVISSAEDFQAKVLDAKTPVLVDFFATWCGPCRMVAPVIDEIATEKAGQVGVYKVDIDQTPDLAIKYQVSSVPTLIVFEGGQVKKQALGAQPKQNILAML
jgi:thioredoxin 1